MRGVVARATGSRSERGRSSVTIVPTPDLAVDVDATRGLLDEAVDLRQSPGPSPC